MPKPDALNARFAVPGVDASTPLGAAAPAILLAKAEPLFVLEEAARGGADADAVHDMRVASRRLREAMRLLRPLYPKREFRRWYGRVRRITRALGPVRDSDVFIGAFAALAPELAEGGRRAVAFVIGWRSGQRVAELEALNRELSRLDLVRNREAFVRFARELAGSAGGVEPLAAFAHAEIAERVAVIVAAQPQALRVERVPEQHALRIDYKRLRYAAEAFAPCYGGAFADLHRTLTVFQDTLGELHDTHVFREALADAGLREAAGPAGVSDGDIAEVESLLDAHALARYEAFVALAEKHPAEALRDALLAPLEPVVGA